MPTYRMYQGKKLIVTTKFDEKEIKHLRDSGYAKKKNVRFVKVKRRSK